MVDAAIELFAVLPVDEVTVLDIATAVGMTPAAIYYHFASKEQILLEGLERFRSALLAEVAAQLPQKGSNRTMGDLLVHLVGWTRRNRSYATVYFVSSVGLNQLVEAVRRETRIDLVDQLRKAARVVRGRISPPEAGVIAVALVSLLETAAASMLDSEVDARAFTGRRFADEVRRLADRITGLAVPA